MHDVLVAADDDARATSIWFVATDTYARVCEDLDAPARAFAHACGFEPKAGRHLVLPGADGELAGILFGIESAEKTSRDLFLAGRLPLLLPGGTYRFANDARDTRLATLAFALDA